MGRRTRRTSHKKIRNRTQGPRAHHMVSIVIPTVNDVRMVRDCVMSIAEHSGTLPHEVIVADDGSPASVQEALAEMARELDFKLVASKTNRGFSATCNLGMGEATGDAIVLMNNDVLVHSGWLEAMLKCADRSESIGIVGARLLYPDDTLQHAGVFFDERIETGFDHRFRHGHRSSFEALQDADVVAVTFALALIKRSVLESIGLMDERLFISLEDVDYCLAARQAGYRVVYCARATATHLEGVTRGKRFFDMDPLLVVKQMDTLDLFFSKWADSGISERVSGLEGFERFCGRWLDSYSVLGSVRG